MHPDQLSVSVDDVRKLIAQQFASWAELEVRKIAAQGTVNALFRIGDRLVARFPLRPGDAPSVRRWIETEAQAARELYGRTRFATPRPVAIGEPGAGYPLPWSVQTWIPGTVAFEVDPGMSETFAHDLAEFIREVRAVDTRGRTFSGSGRGGDLQASDRWVETCLKHSQELFDVARLRRLWDQLRILPRQSTDVMTHGDLTPGNVLLSDAPGPQTRLVGVLDVGGFGPADPALDLVCAWHLLEDGPRRLLRADLNCDDIEWARGQAWAFEQALGAAWYYRESNASMSRMGQRTLQRILAG